MSGFYEDERIRRKNKLANEAYAEFSAMKQAGLTDIEIANTCHANINASVRNEIFLTILKIVGRSNEEVTD